MKLLLLHHQTEGYELVRYPEKDKTMIKELLDFKKSIDLIISQAFKDNDKFIISMKVIPCCNNVYDLVCL